MARLAFLTLLFQLSSLGHWSVGPFHPGAGDPDAHIQHCHGDTSACGGQPSFVGTYAERPLLNESPPVATSHEATSEKLTSLVSAALKIPDQPPRTA